MIEPPLRTSARPPRRTRRIECDMIIIGQDPTPLPPLLAFYRRAVRPAFGPLHRPRSWTPSRMLRRTTRLLGDVATDVGQAMHPILGKLDFSRLGTTWLFDTDHMHAWAFSSRTTIPTASHDLIARWRAAQVVAIIVTESFPSQLGGSLFRSSPADHFPATPTRSESLALVKTTYLSH